MEKYRSSFVREKRTFRKYGRSSKEGTVCSVNKLGIGRVPYVRINDRRPSGIRKTLRTRSLSLSLSLRLFHSSFYL